MHYEHFLLLLTQVSAADGMRFVVCACVCVCISILQFFVHVSHE